MDTVKRNYIILISLLLILPLVLLLQFHDRPVVNSTLSFDANIKTIREEIEIIKSVASEIMTKMNSDQDLAVNGISENQSLSIPYNLRDPFKYPHELTKSAQKAAPKTGSKSSISSKVTKPKPKPKPKITLSGIIFDKAEPVAIINGDIYKTGDKIGEYSILRINEQGVQMQSGKETRFLNAPVIE